MVRTFTIVIIYKHSSRISSNAGNATSTTSSRHATRTAHIRHATRGTAGAATETLEDRKSNAFQLLLADRWTDNATNYVALSNGKLCYSSSPLILIPYPCVSF